MKLPYHEQFKPKKQITMAEQCYCSVPCFGFRSGYRRAKITYKNKKKVKKFHVLKCWMFSFEGLESFPVAWTSLMET